MTTTLIPDGIFARYYVNQRSTKVVVTDGRTATETELNTGQPTQAEVHEAIERCCDELLKTAAST